MITSSLIAVTPPIQLTVPVCNDSPAEGSVLGQILFLEWKRVQILICAAMMRGLLTEEVAAPVVAKHSETRCLHGLTKGCCAVCIRLAQSGPSKQRGSQTRRFRTLATVWVGVADGCGEFKKKPITRAVDGFEDFSGYVWHNRVNDVATPIEPSCLSRVEQPRLLTQEMLEQLKAKDRECCEKKPGRHTHLNFCPRCWVARVQRVPLKKPCMDCKGLAQFDAAEAKRSTKQAKTLEDYCAMWKAEYERKRLKARRLRERFVYSSDDFDREILASRGSVMGEAVRQFDKDHSRKGNKYRIQ